MIWVLAGPTYLESLLHQSFADQRIRGEWFSAHPQLKGFISACKSEKLKIFDPPAARRLLPAFAFHAELSDQLEVYAQTWAIQAMVRGFLCCKSREVAV